MSPTSDAELEERLEAESEEEGSVEEGGKGDIPSPRRGRRTLSEKECRRREDREQNRQSQNNWKG